MIEGPAIEVQSGFIRTQYWKRNWHDDPDDGRAQRCYDCHHGVPLMADILYFEREVPIGRGANVYYGWLCVECAARRGITPPASLTIG